jgi:FtsZ-binding cell division protein ZapB
MTPFDRYQAPSFFDDDYQYQPDPDGSLEELNRAFDELNTQMKSLGTADDGEEPLFDNPRTKPLQSAAGRTGGSPRTLPPAAVPLNTKSVDADTLGDLAEELAGTIYTAVLEALPALIAETLPDSLSELENILAVRTGRSLQAELDELKGDICGDVESSIRAAEERFEQRLDKLAEDHRREMDGLRAFLERLPVPQVNVPAPVVNVAQPEPAQVFVPPDAIHVVAQAPAPRTTRSIKSIVYDASTGRPAEIHETLTEEDN